MQTRVEQFLELVQECKRGLPRKPDSEMFANFQVGVVVEKHNHEHDSNLKISNRSLQTANHDLQIADYPVEKTAVVESPQKCGLVLKQGEICTGPLNISDREKFGCGGCEYFVGAEG